ncbi:energy transducer TonB [Desulfarculus baarsii]|uniref:energy transducer TonB n=1 Tax=Desulfarculus baarsii TaxID=453230 RepID=UPI0016519919|nr:TonB family protein [Desulfarculus baarsii]
MEKNLEGHDQLGWALAVSLAVHVVVAAAVILWPASQPDRQFFSPAYQVALVSGAALPSSGPPATAKKTAPPKKEMEKPKPAPKPEVKPKPDVKPKPAPPKPEPKPEPKEAIGSKKTVEPKRVKREVKKAEPEPSYEDVLDQRLKKIKSKAESRRQSEQLDDALSAIESKVQAGGGATGPSGAVAMPGGGELSTRFMLYYTEVWERIRRAWVLPEALAGDTSGAMAVVALRINRDGSLNKFWLEESSGNVRLDQSALRAVERAAPFPPLPADLLGPYHEVGLRFRPEDAGQ